nr:exopolygalacturonase-like [Tanacetum cinerariifolium]
MDNDSSIRIAICCVLLMGLIAKNHAISTDPKSKGAKADGKTDDGPAIVAAWTAACAAAPPSSLVLPPGTYLASTIVRTTKVLIQGVVRTPFPYSLHSLISTHFKNEAGLSSIIVTRLSACVTSSRNFYSKSFHNDTLGTLFRAFTAVSL